MAAQKKRVTVVHHSRLGPPHRIDADELSSAARYSELLLLLAPLPHKRPPQSPSSGD